MSTLLAERESGIGAERAALTAQTRLTDSAHGPTLDRLIAGVWEGLRASEAVSCPACGGAMAPRFGAGPDAVGGSCNGCGAQLS